jgi:hypothetical protein
LVLHQILVERAGIQLFLQLPHQVVAVAVQIQVTIYQVQGQVEDQAAAVVTLQLVVEQVVLVILLLQVHPKETTAAQV